MLNNQETILLVDDEEDFLESAKELVTKFGLNCLTANTGKGALELLEKHNVNLIVSDINMPGMEGTEFITKMLLKNLNIPFIFLTGNIQKENILYSLRLGAFDYIEKPVKRDEIKSKIFKALDFHSRQNREKTDSLSTAYNEKMKRLLKVGNAIYSS